MNTELLNALLLKKYSVEHQRNMLRLLRVLRLMELVSRVNAIDVTVSLLRR